MFHEAGAARRFEIDSDNVNANDYRLIAMVQYRDGVLMIRFFGSHEHYDKVDAETV